MINMERVDTQSLNVESATPFGINWSNNTRFEIFGIYHGKVGTFSFADGHAEGHKWVDPIIIADGLAANRSGVRANIYGQPEAPFPSYTSPDVAWLLAHWRDKRNP